MERRNYLKGVGGIVGAATIGGAALLFGSDGASATALQNFGSASASSDDGSVEYVAIFGDSVVEWDGFDEPAVSFSILTEARVPGQVGWTELNDTGEVALSQGDSWGNHDEKLSGEGTSGTIETGIGLGTGGNHDSTTDWHVVGSDPDGYGLPQNSIDPSNLKNDSDGTTETFTIEIRSTYDWYDANNNDLFTKSFTSSVNVDVINEPASATASDGSGDDGAVAE